MGTSKRLALVFRLMSSLPVRKLAALLSLLMILLGGPAGGAFVLCFGGGHMAVEAAQAGKDHVAVAGEDVPAYGQVVEADCIDIPLLQAAPIVTKKQGAAGLDAALPVLSMPWTVAPLFRATVAFAAPTDRPSLDPRLVSHRTVVLLI